MKKLSVLMIIAAGFFWGTMGVFVKSLSSFGFNSAQSAAIRLVFAAVFFVVINLIKSPENLKVKLKDLWMFALIGIGSVLSMSFVYFESIKYNSISVAAILLYTAPIMVTIMSAIFFKEKITAKKLAALITAFAGIVLISYPGGSVSINAKGLALGLLSALSYALYSIIGKFILKKYNSASLTAYAFIFAAAGSLFLCNLPQAVCQFADFSGSVPKLIFWCVGIGLFTAALPYAFYTAGLSGVEPGKASVLASVEPLTATLIGVVFYNERLVPLAILGIIFIFSSVTFLSISKS